MSTSHVIVLGKIKGANGILDALGHNKRTIPTASNVDRTKTSFNYALAGDDTPVNIAMNAKVLMVKAGIDKPRKNAVMAVEVLFSLPPKYHGLDSRPYFNECLNWSKTTFAGELLSFDVHLDESAPHAHAIILPLAEGKMQGNKMVGGIGRLKWLINKFHLDVGINYGLSKYDKLHLTGGEKKALAKAVISKLKKENDPALRSPIWSQMRDAIEKDPLSFAKTMLDAPPTMQVSTKATPAIRNVNASIFLH